MGRGCHQNCAEWHPKVFKTTRGEPRESSELRARGDRPGFSELGVVAPERFQNRRRAMSQKGGLRALAARAFRLDGTGTIGLTLLMQYAQKHAVLK